MTISTTLLVLQRYMKEARKLMRSVSRRDPQLVRPGRGKYNVKIVIFWNQAPVHLRGYCYQAARDHNDHNNIFVGEYWRFNQGVLSYDAVVL